MKADEQELRNQLAMAQANNHKRNLELDALHYVWCDGGCPGGVHRWQENPPTKEVIDAAINNTNRLIRWWLNNVIRKNGCSAYNAEKSRLLSVYRMAHMDREERS